MHENETIYETLERYKKHLSFKHQVLLKPEQIEMVGIFQGLLNRFADIESNSADQHTIISRLEEELAAANEKIVELEDDGGWGEITAQTRRHLLAWAESDEMLPEFYAAQTVGDKYGYGAMAMGLSVMWYRTCKLQGMEGIARMEGPPFGSWNFEKGKYKGKNSITPE